MNTSSLYHPCLGVTVTRIDENSFQIFAPNVDAMEEAKEMIEKILEDEVCTLICLILTGLENWRCLKVDA